MKVLVTGAKGQLGYDLCKELSQRSIEHLGIDIAECDLTDSAQVSRVISGYAPDTVIHCAAFTAVDKAESEPELCRKVNVDATRNIAEVCKALKAKLMYISTDYVFSGEGETAFETDEPYAPQNVYGQTKAEGEQVIRQLLQEFFIVRISWVFGINGNNFIKTMMRLGKEKLSLNVVSDQVGSPTYTNDLSKLLVDMNLTDKFGIYHATNEGYCSWAEFAKAIMEIAGLNCAINPVPTSEYPTPAKRPMNSRLSKRSLDDAGFMRLPTWQDALARYISALKDYDRE